MQAGRSTYRLSLCDIDLETLQLTGSDAEKRRDIAWENVCSAAKACDVTLGSYAVCGWLSAAPDATLADLDRLLERHGVDMRLIAAPASPAQRAQIEQRVLRIVDIHDTSKQCECSMIVSCRPPPHAENETLTHWRTVDENRQMLERSTGIAMMMSDANDAPAQRSLYALGDDKRTQLREACKNYKAGDDVSGQMSLVMHALCRIQVLKATTAQAMEVLQAHIQAYTTNSGHEPRQVIHGVARDGSSVVAFQDAQDATTYISDIALMIGCRADGEQMVAAVPLNDRSAWTGFMPPPAPADSLTASE